jgi:hypothetical protein
LQKGIDFLLAKGGTYDYFLTFFVLLVTAIKLFLNAVE